jgi:hypothetical protein
VVLGMVSYMSPEQVRGQTVDARPTCSASASSSFGIATGTRPFRGDSSVETMSAILKADAPDLPAWTYNLRPFSIVVPALPRKIPTSDFSRRRISRLRCNRR